MRRGAWHRAWFAVALLDHSLHSGFSEFSKPAVHFLGSGVTGNPKTGIYADDWQTQLAWDSGIDRDDSFDPSLLEMGGEAISVFGIGTDQDEKVPQLMQAALSSSDDLRNGRAAQVRSEHSYHPRLARTQGSCPMVRAIVQFPCGAVDSVLCNLRDGARGVGVVEDGRD
jgi:hypothetical protein